jgi:hypothetical protein
VNPTARAVPVWYVARVIRFARKVVSASGLALVLGTLGTLIAACDFGDLEKLSNDSVEAAPPDLGVLLRWFFAHYDTGTDEEVREKLYGVDTLIQKAAEERAGAFPVQVTMEDMAAEDLKEIGLDSNDPTLGAGMLLVSEITCSLEEMEKITIATNQSELFPGMHLSYKRTYTSSYQDFLAHTAPKVGWRTDLSIDLERAIYESTLTGSGRYVLKGSPTGAPVFMSRTYLPQPAKFTKGDGAFDQDYQIEIFFERAPGKTLHIYGIWRQFRLESITTDSPLYRSIVLGNLVDYDVRQGKICRDHAPVPKFD